MVVMVKCLGGGDGDSEWRCCGGDGRRSSELRGNRGESDLKRVTCWFRTHAIDCTYVCSIAFVLSVCVKWVSVLEQMQVSSNAGSCLGSNVQGTVDRTMQGKILF